MSDKERRGPTVGNIVAGILAFGGVVVSYFFVRGQIRNARAAKMEKLSADEKNPAYYAKQFHIAFENDMWFGMGTDEALIRTTMRAIPNMQFFNQVQMAYAGLYKGEQLMERLEKEMTSTELAEMMAILNGKPAKVNTPVDNNALYLQWAKRLKAAFDIKYMGVFPGTDEDAIKAVFMEIPTQRDWARTMIVYYNQYNTALNDDLLDELEPWEYRTLMQIILNKPRG
jgi:hypothetical protein